MHSVRRFDVDADCRGQADILELGRAQQEALSLQFYEDKDILMAAEEECSGELYDRVQ